MPLELRGQHLPVANSAIATSGKQSMSRTDRQPIRLEEPGPETNSPSVPQSVDRNMSDDFPVAADHQPYADWDLLRQSQALSRQLNRPPEPVYCLLDLFQQGLISRRRHSVQAVSPFTDMAKRITDDLPGGFVAIALRWNNRQATGYIRPGQPREFQCVHVATLGCASVPD